MDKRTRGMIESELDDLIKDVRETVSTVDWVRQEIPLSSFRDLVLGYVIGSLETFAIAIRKIVSKEGGSAEDYMTIKTMLKRRLPELIGEIERELGR